MEQVGANPAAMNRVKSCPNQVGIGQFGARIWHRWIHGAFAGLLHLIAVGIPFAATAVPSVGEVVAGSVEVSLGRRIPLPPGSYKVQTSIQQTAQISGRHIGPAQEPVYVLTLVSTDPSSDIPLVVFDFTVNAGANWGGQPCDATSAQNQPIVVQNFGTSASSLTVKCLRVYSVTNVRNTMASAATSSSEWVRSRWGPASASHAQLPNNGLAVVGYISRGNSDRLNYWYYLNPGHYGLDDAAGRPALFRSLDGKDERAPAARTYLAAASSWGESHMEETEKHFFGGRFGVPVPKPIAFGDLRRTTVPGTSNTAGTAIPTPRQTPIPMPAPTAAPTAQTTPSPTPAPAARTAATAPDPAPKPASEAIPVAQPQPVPAPLPPPLKVHALVIGNGAYAGARLSNPRNDASAIADRFKRFGFNVTLVLDSNRQQMVRALAQFSEAARDADVGIVFYAGHGLQVGGINYLLPVDLDLSGNQPVSVALEAVSLDSVLQEHLPGKTRLVFLDACRDNPLAQSMGGSRGGSRGLARIQTALGTLISYATRDGGTAADGDSGNSPYTAGLLANLDATEDIALVLRKVRQHVLTNTRGKQEPWEYGSLVGGSLVLSRVAARP